ncbi:MAG: ABC transporter ATP-binding protein [Oscillospiraceae bacterium]|nr:ABC transporter ATP-binding protein [Oscillospiraceae bacterium]
MIINFKNAVKKYGDNEENMVYAMDHIDLSINEGELCVILGPSGSGKSTLLNMIGGLDSIDEGELIVDGQVINKLSQKQITEYRRSKIGFVFQFFNLIPDLTAEENIQVVSDITQSPLNIDEVLETLGIENLRDRFPKELSGGQQQRIAIARSIIKNPRLLLCDELTGALDSKSSKDVIRFVDKINRTYKTTIVIITHNEAIKNIADRIVRIKDGKIISNELNENRIDAGDIEL